MGRITLTHLQKLKRKKEKIACLTAYDATFAKLVEQAGAEVILVGDSLGMVVQGQDTTCPVSLQDMAYHCQMVHRGTERAFIIADLPFMTYATPEKTLESAAFLMREGQAQMIKVEGGVWLTETIQLLVERGVPVCGHIGLTPQSVHQFGGYKVQGREISEAQRIKKEAHDLEKAGISLLVLECVPRDLARQISQELTIPVIGIGAGQDCDGQVLVLYDMLGMFDKSPSFVKNFLQQTDSIPEALQAYVQEVKSSEFPSVEHSFQ
ncbi:3-methyl-2-oxobutanoate hydroxymethyltransferase [Candidatus Albibeggiatoa sp. nov. NOAA]|uniref:3-methyl-2-oxobutanoate hydroxymethyltransferase n=1 Tax=Candidatus Albibeggiatoa sp. nov. NOAA TaxID=3162724 RepID=UPI0032FC3FAF|nr:3-methyl-2-oxobutanoate hydroxymethyltransferase [Thiotrichaceae bacterium]